MERITLIYNANWSAKGLVDFVWQSMKEDNVCGLCTITHNTVTEKQDWKSCTLASPVPLETKYRNELNEGQIKAAGEEYPCVLFENDDVVQKVLGKEELDECGGSVEKLKSKLNTAVEPYLKRQLFP